MCGTSQRDTVGVVAEDYDVIIVGSGAGGGRWRTPRPRRASGYFCSSGGNFLPRETESWNPGVGEHLLSRMA